MGVSTYPWDILMKKFLMCCLLISTLFSSYSFPASLSMQKVHRFVSRIYKKSKQVVHTCKKYLDDEEVRGYIKATALFAGGVATTYGAAKIYSYMKKANPITRILDPLKDKVTIGKSVCMGKEKQDNGETVTQIKVACQEYTDCGYHAIKNGNYIVQELQQQQGTLHKNVQDTDVVEKYFGKNGRWRKIVEQYRAEINAKAKTEADKRDSTNSYLSSDEIEEVKKEYHLVELSACDVIEDVSLLSKKDAPVMEKSDPAYEGQGEVDYISPIVKASLEHAKQENRDYYHQFILGTMQHFESKKGKQIRGTQGHWFVVVLHQLACGARRYIIADSLDNAVRIDDPRVTKLRQVLR